MRHHKGKYKCLGSVGLPKNVENYSLNVDVRFSADLATGPTVVSPLQHTKLDLTLHAHRCVRVGDPERCDLA